MNTWKSYERQDFMDTFGHDEQRFDQVLDHVIIDHEVVFCDDLIFVRQPDTNEEIQSQFNSYLLSIEQAQKNLNRLTELGVALKYQVYDGYVFVKRGVDKLAKALHEDLVEDDGDRIIKYHEHTIVDNTGGEK